MRLDIQDKADLFDYMGWLNTVVFMILLYFVFRGERTALFSSHKLP